MTSSAHQHRLDRDRNAAIPCPAQKGNQQPLQPRDRHGRKQAAGEQRDHVSPQDAQKVLAAVHTGPKEEAEEIDVHQEHARKIASAAALAAKTVNRRSGCGVRIW